MLLLLKQDFDISFLLSGHDRPGTNVHKDGPLHDPDLWPGLKVRAGEERLCMAALQACL